MDGSRHHYTTGSKSERERQMPYDITYMWNLTYDTNKHITKQKQTLIQTCGCQVLIERTDLWLAKVGAGGGGKD